MNFAILLFDLYSEKALQICHFSLPEFLVVLEGTISFHQQILPFVRDNFLVVSIKRRPFYQQIFYAGLKNKGAVIAKFLKCKCVGSI
jgi:hypothetical protein